MVVECPPKDTAQGFHLRERVGRDKQWFDPQATSVQLSFSICLPHVCMRLVARKGKVTLCHFLPGQHLLALRHPQHTAVFVGMFSD